MAYADRDRVKAWLDAGHGQKLSTLDRIVLITIAEEVNSKTGLAWPGHELMITRWGMGSASVKRAMVKLCRLGMLEVAHHGSFGRRSRYRLAGELIDAQRDHTDTVTQRDQTDPMKPSGDHSVPVTGSLSTSNGIPVIPVNRSLLRSSNGEEDSDDDGATHRAPLGSLGAAPTVAVKKQISAALGYTDDEATEWIESKLAGREVRNIDAYLLRCLDSHKADTAKASAGRSSTKKSAAKPAPAKAGKKTSGKTKRKQTGPHCKGEGCDTLLRGPEAGFTGYCARHQSDNRQHCKTEGCRGTLMVLREMKAGYCRKCLAADLSQPPVWSESIQTDSLGFTIERRPTSDGWANLLLYVDIPVSSNGTAADKASGQLFEAIAKGLYWGDRPRVWSNAIDVDIPDDWFDYRADDIRRTVADGRVQYLARQLSAIVTANPKGTAA